MELSVKLFATLKDRAGRESVSIALPEPATVQDMLNAIGEQHPALAPALPTALVAVNKDFAFPDTAVTASDEIALFPPVSGGAESFPHAVYFALTPEPLDIDAIHEHISGPDVGAIVSFTGHVRGRTDRQGLPDETLYLEYEAYSGMAEAKMAQIAREIWRQWPKVKGVAIVQRIGRLDVGDVTTFVACAGGHRDEGVFEAARYGIDRLKEIVPVWKKEVGPDQSVWVEGSYRPSEADRDNSASG